MHPHCRVRVEHKEGEKNAGVLGASTVQFKKANCECECPIHE